MIAMTIKDDAFFAPSTSLEIPKAKMVGNMIDIKKGEEHAHGGFPIEPQHHAGAEENIHRSINSEDGVGGEFFHDTRANESTCEETG
jgi:hypothetical protein